MIPAIMQHVGPSHPCTRSTPGLPAAAENVMSTPLIKTLVLDALQNTDGPRRDRALQRLIEFAQRAAAARNPAHAESVGLSAVAYVQDRAARGELSFQTEGELLGYLNRVARGKAVNQIRKDLAQLGDPGARVALNDATGPGLEGRVTADAGTIASEKEMGERIRAWLERYPSVLRRAIAERATRELATGVTIDSGGLHAVTQAADEVSSSLREVLDLLPEQLRVRAGRRFAEVEFEELPALFTEVAGRLRAARSLSPRDRLIMEMRESGWSPKDIADKLHLQPTHVRVIHKRVCDRLVRLPSQSNDEAAASERV